MIEPYTSFVAPDDDARTTYALRREYSEAYARYSKLSPYMKLLLQNAKLNVWFIEIKLINILLESSKINEMEKLILIDHYNILLKEYYICMDETYKLPSEEILKVYPEEEEFLKNVKNSHVEIETISTMRHIDFDVYGELSSVEKIRLRIMQNSMLNAEKFVLVRRRKSKELNIPEKIFLESRIEILDECSKHNEKYIRYLFFHYVFSGDVSRDSTEVSEIFEEIEKANISCSSYKSDHWERENFLEFFRYPYDFERPNNVPPDQWGNPKINWKTGMDIHKE